MYCNQCGAKIKDTDGYCKECGSVNRLLKETVYARKFRDSKSDEDFQVLYNESYRIVVKAISDFFIEDKAELEDCIQTIYLKVYQKIDQYDPNRPFPAWLYTVARNTAIDFWRKKGKKIHMEEVPLVEEKDGEWEQMDLISTYEEFDPTAEIDKSEKDNIIRGIMEALPQASKICVLMYYIQEIKIKDIASELNISEGTVKNRISYGKKIIKKRVMEYQNQGLKLYSVSPVVFFLLLIKEEQDEFAAICGALKKQIYISVSDKIKREAPCINGHKNDDSGNISKVSDNTLHKRGKKIVKRAMKQTVKQKFVTVAILAIILGASGTIVVKNISAVPQKNEDNKEEKVIKNEQYKAEEETIQNTKEKESSTPQDNVETYKEVFEAYYNYIQSEYTEIDGVYVTDLSEFPMNHIKIENLKYVFLDMDGNGKDELLIAGERTLYGAYTTDGTNIYKLSDDESLGNRQGMLPCKNGIFKIYWLNSAFSMSYEFYKLSQDGTSLELLDQIFYEYDLYYRGDFQSKEEISKDEYDEIYSSYEELNDVEWIPFMDAL